MPSEQIQINEAEGSPKEEGKRKEIVGGHNRAISTYPANTRA